jgi:hypothetical protein
MRFQEILSNYSVGDSLIFEMFEELKQRKLVEHNTNYQEYNHYINQEKIHTMPHLNIIPGNNYFPLGFQAVPTAEIIFIKYSTLAQTYLNSQRGKLFFNLNAKVIDYPLTRSIGDGLLDTLIYDKLTDLNNFILSLKLKFSSWDIRYNIV